MLHPLIHWIKDNFKFLLHVRYLNDMNIIGDSKEVAKVLDIIQETGLRLDLKLNICKIEIFGIPCDDNKI